MALGTTQCHSSICPSRHYNGDIQRALHATGVATTWFGVQTSPQPEQPVSTREQDGRSHSAIWPSPTQPGLIAARGPRQAHNVSTTPELLLRRQQRQAAAQDLTRRIVECTCVATAEAIYRSHESEFNAIHFSALFTTLARLAHPIPAASGRRHHHRAPPRQLSIAERDQLHRFVAGTLVPSVGLKLMGLGPRQLAGVLAALAYLHCPPPAFWMAEWLQHFARRLEPLPPSPQGALHASGLEIGLSRSPPPPQRPASRSPSQSQCTAGDLSQAMWALGRLRRPNSGAVGPCASAAMPVGAITAAVTPSAASGNAGSTSPAMHAGGFAGGGRGRSEAGPSLEWLNTVATAFASAAITASAADLSSYLWAAAQLGYRPPEATMTAVARRCQQLLAGAGAGEQGAAGAAARGGRLGPRELSVVLWALAVLGFRPGPAWLARAAQEVARMAGASAEAEATPRVAAAQLPVDLKAAGTDAGSAVLPKPPCDVASGLELHAAPTDYHWWQEHLREVGPSVAASPAAPSAVPPSPAEPAPASPSSPVPAPALAAAPRRPAALLDARQAATCAWALARLGYRPSAGSLHALLARVCSPPTTRPSQPPRHTATATSSLQSSSSSPSAAAALAGDSLAPQPAWLQGGPPHALTSTQDLSMLAFALGLLRFRPEPQHALALLFATATRMGVASGQDLVVWAAALSRMCLAVPVPWVTAFLAISSWHLERLSPLALVNWVDAVARLRTAEPQWWREVAARRCRAAQAAAGKRRRWEALHGRTPWRAEGALRCDTLVFQRRRLLRAAVAWHDADGVNMRAWVASALPAPGQPTPPRLEQPCVHDRVELERRRLAPATHSTIPSADSDHTSSGIGRVRRSSSTSPSTSEGLVVRPASRQLRRSLMRRVERVSLLRMPALGLELQCRLAWAAARLHVPVGRRWVESVVSCSAEALERRLHQAQAQQRGPPATRGSQGPQGQEAGPTSTHLMASTADTPLPASPAAEPAAAGRLAGDSAVVVVAAAPLVKLVWAVAALLRPSRHLKPHEFRMRRKGQRPLQHLGGGRPAHVRRQQRGPSRPRSRAAASALEAESCGSSLRRARSLRRRQRWCGLVLTALLPQLPSLSNEQLLRLVHGLVQVAGVPPQRPLTAALRDFCRRRVAATCGSDAGGEEACDLTTAGLLHWSKGWGAEVCSGTGHGRREQRKRG